MKETESQEVSDNEKEFGEISSSFRWVTPAQAEEASRERREILSGLNDKVTIGFCGTKLDCKNLSPGCILCGAGGWSCLFVNGLCNGRCFYCPAEQKSRSIPMTAGLEFENPQDYVDYIEKLGIRGVGLTGGEPFLTFERTLSFAARIKRRFGDGIYLWIYTNGSAVTEEGLRKLKAAGLDEIRFDLSAFDYDTSKLPLAAGIIGTVTVEIPAIPDHLERLKGLVKRLPGLGVKHLNLHQLRVTPHNCRNLLERGYTFLHGEKVTVLESELTALRILRFSKEEDLGIPINYCSFAYRSRFQGRGQRMRLAKLVTKPFEDVTASGAIRGLIVKGKKEDIDRVEGLLKEAGADQKEWLRDSGGIHMKASPWRDLPAGVRPKHVTYHIPLVLPSVSYMHPFEKITLNRKRAVFIERHTAQAEREISDMHARELLEIAGSEKECADTPQETESFPFERIPFGLQEYR